MSSRSRSRTRRSTLRRHRRSSTVPERLASRARASSSGEIPDASAKPTPLMSTTSRVHTGSRRARRAWSTTAWSSGELVMSRSPSSRTVIVPPSGSTSTARVDCALRKPRAPSATTAAPSAPFGRPRAGGTCALSTPSDPRHARAWGPGRIAGMSRDFRTVGVVGLGTMGAGIAEVFAREGLQVVGVEPTEEALERGRGHLRSSTDRAVKRGKLTEADRDALVARVRFSTSMEDLADVDLLVEAVPERLDLKQEVFSAADKICRPDTVLATNTSSLSVTEISVATSRPSKVVGMHWFNPAPVLKLVEVGRTVVTEQEVVDDVTALAERLGKKPVVIGDKAGFIANALLFGYLNHAVSMLESHYATREDIDDAMRLGCGYPMGPLALLDLIGLDTAYEILDTMYRQSRDRLHAPAPILKQMVTAGLRGRKTGRGFYTYEAADSPKVVDDTLTPGSGGAHEAGRDVRRIGVVGSGTMATGIVEVLAKAGYDVLYVTRGEEKVARVRADLERSLDKAVLRGKLEQGDRDAALGRVAGSKRLDDLAECDLVIEAVVEELSVKQALFSPLDEICKPGAVLATTPSSLPVVEPPAATSPPADVVGLHFFNPAPVMSLVE